MQSETFQKNATSQSIEVFIQDATTGLGKTGLAYNTVGLTAYYRRAGAASAAITLATQTTTGAYSSGGFVEIDGTNMPGKYRLDVPNAVLATGVNQASIQFNLSGAFHRPIQIDLTDYDPNAADPNVTDIKAKTDSLTFTVSGVVDANIVDWKGSTAPAMTGDAYARLGAPAGASVSADIAAVNAKTTNLPASPAAVGSNMGTVTSVTGNVGGNVVGSVGSVSGAVGSVTGNVGGNVVGSVASVTATVNADVKKINGTTVNGDGSGAPWGP